MKITCFICNAPVKSYRIKEQRNGFQSTVTMSCHGEVSSVTIHKHQRGKEILAFDGTGINITHQASPLTKRNVAAAKAKTFAELLDIFNEKTTKLSKRRLAQLRSELELSPLSTTVSDILKAADVYDATLRKHCDRIRSASLIVTSTSISMFNYNPRTTWTLPSHNHTHQWYIRGQNQIILDTEGSIKNSELWTKLISNKEESDEKENSSS